MLRVLCFSSLLLSFKLGSSEQVGAEYSTLCFGFCEGAGCNLMAQSDKSGLGSMPPRRHLGDVEKSRRSSRRLKLK